MAPSSTPERQVIFEEAAPNDPAYAATTCALVPFGPTAVADPGSLALREVVDRIDARKRGATVATAIEEMDLDSPCWELRDGNWYKVTEITVGSARPEGGYPPNYGRVGGS